MGCNCHKPAAKPAQVFTVRAGENTSQLAARMGVSVPMLVMTNMHIPRTLINGQAVFAVLVEGQQVTRPNT